MQEQDRKKAAVNGSMTWGGGWRRGHKAPLNIKGIDKKASKLYVFAGICNALLLNGPVKRQN